MPGDPASPVVTEPGRNILDNSSFEQGLGGWATAGGELSDREADAAVAWHGGHSCRVFSDEEGADGFSLTSPIFRAEAGQEYSLSCYARASQPGVSLSLSLRNTAFAAQISTTAALSTEWQRVAVTGKAGETRRQTYFAMIGVNGIRKGLDAWIDAVQVECGPVTDYRPSGSLEFGAITDRFANVFLWGEPVVVRPIVANWTEQPRRCGVAYSLRDHTGREVRSGKLDVEARAEATTGAQIAVGSDWRGYGQAILDLTAPGEEGSLRYRCHFATIPKPAGRDPAQQPFFGVHGRGTFARNWDLLETIGAQTAKVYYGWVSQQPDGSCDFAAIDATVQGLLHHHLVPIVCLGTWPPGWAERKGADGKPTGELDLEAWDRYVAECVTHLKAVRLFESWNEIYGRGASPNTLELLWRAQDVCKRLRPDAVMMSNPIAGVGTGDEFYREFLRARNGRPLEAVALHYPWDSFRDSPERGHMRELLESTRRDAATIGHGHPDLYVTESGFHPGADLHAPGMAVMESDFVEGAFCTQREKPEWMVQTFLIALEEQVRAYCEFDWCGYAQGPPWYSSLTFNDMQPTPGLSAYAVATHLLSGARVERALPITQGPTRGLVVRRGDETMTWLWSATGDALVPVRAKGMALAITDIMGAERRVAVASGAAVLPLSDGPICVHSAIEQAIDPVTISGQSPSPWAEGKAYKVTVKLANPFDRPWHVELRGPEGWQGTAPLPALTLRPRETRTASLTLTPTGAGLGVPLRVECRAEEGTFADETRVDLASAESMARAEREPVIALDDFEGDLGGWSKDVPPGATLEVTPSDVAHSGARSMRLHFVHSQPTGGWASTVTRYAPPPKWSAYAGLEFWVYPKERPAGELQVHLLEDHGGTYCAKVKADLEPGKWHRITLPFREFRLGGWTRDPDNALDLDGLVGLALVGVAQEGTSEWLVDEVRVVKAGQ